MHQLKVDMSMRILIYREFAVHERTRNLLTTYKRKQKRKLNKINKYCHIYARKVYKKTFISKIAI